MCWENGRFFFYLSRKYMAPHVCSMFPRVKSDRKRSIAAISRLEFLIHQLPALIDFKVLLDLVGDELFPTLFASLSPLYLYFHGKCPDELHSLVPALQLRPTMLRIRDQILLRISFVRRKFH